MPKFPQAFPIHGHFPSGHHDVHQHVTETDVGLDEGVNLLVRIDASIRSDPNQRPHPGKPLGATILTIRMDPRVAIELSRQIRDLAQTKGWPLPK